MSVLGGGGGGGGGLCWGLFCGGCLGGLGFVWCPGNSRDLKELGSVHTGKREC